jgi:hypothetical protein
VCQRLGAGVGDDGGDRAISKPATFSFIPSDRTDVIPNPPLDEQSCHLIPNRFEIGTDQITNSLMQKYL